MTVVTWHWRGLGRMGAPVRYKREFSSAAAARECMERVLEGRDEARHTVRCDDGVLRRLGTSDSAYSCDVIERRPASAPTALVRMLESARRSA